LAAAAAPAFRQPGFAAISRTDVASFMLKQATDDQYVRQMPIISY
jgi:hypothetical protein